MLIEARYNNAEVATVYDRNRDGVISAGDLVEATTTSLDCGFASESTAVLDVIGAAPTDDGVRVLLPPRDDLDRALDLAPGAIAQVRIDPGIAETGARVSNDPTSGEFPSGAFSFFVDLDPDDDNTGAGQGTACVVGRVDVSGPAL
ncbi:MAG: hypothetical protein AAFY28_10735 [Actinomycetota bacterium]